MEFKPNRKAFERVRHQIGFCGIWCGSCAVGNGCLSGLGEGLRELLTAYGLPQWASLKTGWEPFLEALGSLKKAISCPGCHQGGGRDGCEIRACARRKKLAQCVDCSAFSDCEHAGILDHMRAGANKIGLAVLSRQDGREDRNRILEKWTQELAARWPGCILFAEDSKE